MLREGAGSERGRVVRWAKSRGTPHQPAHSCLRRHVCPQQPHTSAALSEFTSFHIPTSKTREAREAERGKSKRSAFCIATESATQNKNLQRKCNAIICAAL